MLTDVYHDLETNIYDVSCLCVPKVASIYTPPNPTPDDRVGNGTCMYMHLTSITGPTHGELQQTSALPIMDGGLIYGGQMVMHGAKVLPKITIEGFIDTPCVKLGEYYVGIPFDFSGTRYLYPEIIAMMVEGRANVHSDGRWDRLDPLWWRDPYGRVYNNPRILDFSASYVEGVPERMQFVMTLKV